jgi:hypothetical protein
VARLGELQLRLASQEGSLQAAKAEADEARARLAELEGKCSDLEKVTATVQQEIEACKLSLRAADADNAQLKRQCDNHIAVRRAGQASLSQQLSVDGRVTSGIDTPAKVYKALKLVRRGDGQLLDVPATTFKKPLADFKDRRIRDLLRAVQPPIETILQAFHTDWEGLLALLAANVTSSTSARKVAIHPICIICC